jgi:hypothetical protein
MQQQSPINKFQIRNAAHFTDPLELSCKRREIPMKALIQLLPPETQRSRDSNIERFHSRENTPAAKFPHIDHVTQIVQHPIDIIMEGEVEADDSVANDIAMTGVASQPPSSQNRHPSCTERDPSSIERDHSCTERDHSCTERDPFSIERDPSSIERDPSSIERDPFSIEHERDPARTERDTERAPSIIEHAPSITKHTPSITGHAPFITEHAPSITEHAPFITERVPFSPNRSAPDKHAPVEIDYATLGPEHGKLVKLLEDRGAVEGLIDNSTGVDVKKLMFAGVFHDEPDKIISFLLSEAKSGKFRRTTLQEHTKEDGVHRLVYWQHFYGSGNIFVEFLLDVRVASPDKSTQIMKLKPFEGDLPDEAAARLVKILDSTSIKTIKGGIIKGEMSLTNYEYGQAAVTITGTLQAQERTAKAKAGVDVGIAKRFESWIPKINSNLSSL